MLTRMKSKLIILTGLFLLILSTLLMAGWGRVKLPEVRAIWVTRFDYKSPRDVAKIVENCARAGFTDIFFQVRGNGTVFYPSRVEPWAFELSGKSASGTGQNPGWNPLLTAANSSKRYGIRLHAYINVLPGWRGREIPPASAGQLWTAHPDWFMVDSTGTKMKPTSKWYSFVNPVNPEVRRHLTKLAEELAQYDIAGLHLDYIRFPYDYKDVAKEIYPQASPQDIKAHSTFSYDPMSLAQLSRRHGGRINPSDRAHFFRSAVSQVVVDLNKSFKSKRGAQSIVSSSVLADFNSGYNTAYQDTHRWVKNRMVDWVVPMNYSASLYDERLQAMHHTLGKRASARQLVVGINCVGDSAEIARQVEMARRSGCRGFALFAYSYFFENHQPTAKARDLLHKM